MKITHETICNCPDTKNGASPLWALGSTAIMRFGDEVFASVPMPAQGVLPLSDRHTTLYRRGGEGWEKYYAEEGFTREPAPLLRLDGSRLLLTENPSVFSFAPGEGREYSKCVPTLKTFDISSPGRAPKAEAPVFDEADYPFMDHSYRGCAADRDTGAMLLSWQYIDAAGEGRHCWTYRDGAGRWAAAGKLGFPVRVCYHNLALRGGRACVFGVSDICEPVLEWRAYKYEKTGVKWDYDFRNLWFCAAQNIESGGFGPPLLVDSREESCGYMRNLDIFLGSDGVCHMLYTAKRVWHEFMRDKFFPGLPLDSSLEYCAAKDGKIIEKRTLDIEKEDGGAPRTAAWHGAFHECANGELRILSCKSGGQNPGHENGWRLSDLKGKGQNLDIPAPPQSFQTARPRCGGEKSDVIDILINPAPELQYIKIEL